MATPRPAHAADYAWFREESFGLAGTYCFTHVQGLTAEELRRRFGAVPAGEVTGLHAITETGPEDRTYVAVTELDGWALAVEPDGFLGVTPEAITRLAEGTRLVAHFRDVDAHEGFRWWEHGVERLSFEPHLPHRRGGTDADAPGTPELLTACGFDLGGESTGGHTAATFALAERLTDVRLTPEQLATLTFRLGHVPKR